MMSEGGWGIGVGLEERSYGLINRWWVSITQFLMFATVTRSTINVLTKTFHSDSKNVIVCETVKRFFVTVTKIGHNCVVFANCKHWCGTSASIPAMERQNCESWMRYELFLLGEGRLRSSCILYPEKSLLSIGEFIVLFVTLYREIITITIHLGEQVNPNVFALHTPARPRPSNHNTSNPPFHLANSRQKSNRLRVTPCVISVQNSWYVTRKARVP